MLRFIRNLSSVHETTRRFGDREHRISTASFPGSNMPDVHGYSIEGKRTHQEAIVDEEITRIASKVLSDLESFVDEGSDSENQRSDDEDDGRESSRVIGVSLDELRLILDTSIRRHVCAESPHPHPIEAPVVSLSPVQSKRNMKIYPRPVQKSSRSPLSELQQLLQSKQQEFARVRDQNRAAERTPRVERGHKDDDEDLDLRSRRDYRDERNQRKRQDDEERDHDNHRHWRERLSFSSMHRSPRSLASSSSSASSASSLASTRARSTTSQRGGETAPRVSVNNQATETDDVCLEPSPHSTLCLEIQRAEKACSISPSDLGPAISDLPATTTLDLSGRPQSPQSDRSASISAHTLRQRSYERKSKKRLQDSESGWSSSSSSSRSQSSVGSEFSRRHNRREGRSRDTNRNTGDGHRLNDSRPQEKNPELISTLLPDNSAPTASEQLDWELDLSNFNI